MNVSQEVRTGVLFMVDLAGSERAAVTQVCIFTHTTYVRTVTAPGTYKLDPHTQAFNISHKNMGRPGYEATKIRYKAYSLENLLCIDCAWHMTDTLLPLCSCSWIMQSLPPFEQ